MSVSKRLRFEILRRDGFRCYYCGTRGNETGSGLTVDHVTPTALGGTDIPENLVAACGDCNSGKGAASLEAEAVAGVRSSLQLIDERKRDAGAKASEMVEKRLKYGDQIRSAWKSVAPGYARLPQDVESTIDRWHRDHVPVRVIAHGFDVAWSRTGIPTASRFRYAIGVIRNALTEAEGT
jgi:hypothetical protein